MAIYLIGSLYIKADNLPSSYDVFKLCQASSCQNVSLTFLKRKYPFCITEKRLITSLPNMHIFMNTSLNCYGELIFEARNGMCTFVLNSNLDFVEYYYSGILGIFESHQIDEILKPFFQIILESILTRNKFVILHGSCVEIDGLAYVFSGPSGIGKSTRAKKWCELLSASWISGDRPIVDTINGSIYGAPWDGKESIYRNYNCPLAGIFMVARSSDVYIKKKTKKEKLQYLCKQSFIPMWDPKLAACCLHSIGKLIENVPIFEMGCDITNESIIKSYNIILDNLKSEEN